MTHFVAYPEAVIYDLATRKKPVQHLLWGDWIQVLATEGDWARVKARGEDGWMQANRVTQERLLEVAFIDVGQGDGCLIVTPEDRHIVIDAGEGDNMARFLRWRYGDFRQKFAFESMIISHPDQDHYGGFKDIFDIDNLEVGTLYHNGLVSRESAKEVDELGPRVKDQGVTYVSDILQTQAALDALLADKARVGQNNYPRLLARARARARDIRSLDASVGWLPGYDKDKELSLRVLGPVVEKDQTGTPRLRWLGDSGKTKNGHSILLQLQYRGVTLLLGGDLNIPAEHHLLRHYTGQEVPPRDEAGTKALLDAARRTFRSDICKACHHGSADFTELFLQAIDPLATVISSGDDEGYCHPRADALGAIGRWGHGQRPLIFSTELARSSKEIIKHPHVLRAKLAALLAGHEEAKKTDREELEKALTRSVAVFGAIHLRTDGRRAIMAQRIESPRSPGKKWDLYALDRGDDGLLTYRSKHD